MVRRRFHPIIALAAIVAAAGSVTAAGLTFTAHTLSRTVAETPPAQTTALPSYVLRMPETKVAALDMSATEAPPTVTVSAAAPAAAVARPTTVAATAPVATTPPGDLYVVKSDVFVRSGPSKSYGQIGTAMQGTQLTVSGKQGGWLKVSFEGSSGWIYQRYLERADNSGTPATASNGAPL